MFPKGKQKQASTQTAQLNERRSVLINSLWICKVIDFSSMENKSSVMEWFRAQESSGSNQQELRGWEDGGWGGHDDMRSKKGL
jgi:hypothetical protein